MRGSEYDKAEDERRMMQLLHDCVCLRFAGGRSIAEIAAMYQIEPWLVENILREHVRA